jgi:multicomponent Na+:H+ antiporter subunit E
MVILFFLLWLLLSGEVTVSVCLWGLVATGLVYCFYRQIPADSRPGKQWTLARLWMMVRYLWNLLLEMLKASIIIMKLIYTRGKGMRPKMIWFDTTLKSNRDRVLLANSITLTAGTITVAVEENGRFCVHTLDASLAEGIEACQFQQRLEQMEA